MLGLGLGVSTAQAVPLARYGIGGKVPEILGDFAAGAYAIKGRGVAFGELFSFSRTSAAWKRNALGHWVKALAGEPRAGHHIWKGGRLVPAGIAVNSEVRTNLIRYSEALDVADHWPQSNGVGVEPAGELSGIPAFRLTDTNPSGYAQINQAGVTHGDGIHVCKVLVAKDQNPTSQFSIRLIYSIAGVSTFSGMSLKVDTGTKVNTWSDNVVERAVEDHGDHWLIWFAVDLTGAGNVTMQVFPAHNDVSGAGGADREGAHVCTAVQLHPGRYPQDYIKTEAAAVDTASETLQIDPSVLSAVFGGVMPEALTIVMKGTTTYEDEGGFNTAKLVAWRVSDDYLEISLDTSGAETGEVNFKSKAGGVLKIAKSATDAYAPGVDVPFSIALTVTATEIEGFCNGVSTGKTTHDGLANLLSAPMGLFPIGSGTVEHFAIYVGNPGSEALQEVTS
jgi:hypothetical protein